MRYLMTASCGDRQPREAPGKSARASCRSAVRRVMDWLQSGRKSYAYDYLTGQPVNVHRLTSTIIVRLFVSKNFALLPHEVVRRCSYARFYYCPLHLRHTRASVSQWFPGHIHTRFFSICESCTSIDVKISPKDELLSSNAPYKNARKQVQLLLEPIAINFNIRTASPHRTKLNRFMNQFFL